jgi:Cd2+/Zn2+-exporting ATPase
MKEAGTEPLPVARFHVEGMDCAACGTKVEAAARRVDGVRDVSVSVQTGVMSITHMSHANLENVSEIVTRLGYPSSRLPDRREISGKPTAAEPAPPWWRSRKALLVGSCGLAIAAAYALGKTYPAVERIAFLVALAVGLVPVAWRAIKAAATGVPFSIEMLMTIAAVGAVAIGATEEAAAVVFLFLVGELLEGLAASRARASIQGLAALVPKAALVLTNDLPHETPVERLKIGDVILARPGDRISADGEIVEGQSQVNEAPVTGESAPKLKGKGDVVFAGTVNGDATLRIRVSAAAADNTIARIVALVEEAQESKAPTERFIDGFSRYYTPAVVVVGALVAIMPPLLLVGSWNEWIYKGLAILLIGCPCALVISTPAAIAAALSSGARRGLLLKGGVVLEQLRSLTIIAFDKTGTLTQGNPSVTDVIPARRTEKQVLSAAAALETGSNHPLAIAIVERAKAQSVPLPPAIEARAIPGKGVAGTVGGEKLFLGSLGAAAELTDIPDEIKVRAEALYTEGKSVSVLLAGSAVAGLIAMRDEPRDDAKQGLVMLRNSKIKTLMLTGDNRSTAEAIGKMLGIEVRAELLPQDKMAIVASLQRSGEKVGKVGDGINDAPALAAADVGIAMGGGTDVALETADAAVLHGRVSDVASMIDLSRRTMLNIYQNITIALGLKAVFLVTTIAGITGLWPAILADTGATVLVTANALQLLRAKSD